MISLLQKKQASASASMPVEVRKPDEGSEDQEYDGLQSAADDLISAIHSKNPKLVAEALKAAFEICDSYPHEDGEHIDG